MRAGVLDAGVVLTRMSPKRRGHAQAVKLFGGGGPSGPRLIISTVNLAEVLEHARGLVEGSGFDPVAALRHLGVEIDAPDADVARRVARLAADDLSLADRFALATAQARTGRLYTTDGVLANAARVAKIPVTRI